MIWNNVELFNVDHIEKRDNGDVVLYRFPKDVINAFGDDFQHESKYVARMTTGCEIRFVCDAVDITLSASDEDGYVEIYRGDFYCRTERIKKGVRNRIALRKKSNIDLYNMSDVKTTFSNDVWRIIFAHDFCGVICDIDAYTPIRPPVNEELPSKIMLAYGSSITHGACSQVYTNSYISRCAKHLGVDVLCKGMGGSCFCEPKVADYIECAEWDFAVLELAVNMIDHFTSQQFKERVEFLVKKSLTKNRPVVLISHFRHFRDLDGATGGKLNNELIAITKEIYDKYNCDNLFYIDGKSIIDDYTMLSADLIHPSIYGHSEMGKKIADKIHNEFSII